tara:strand:+ start:520 stop:921 length:402 start_codon:yes stop_codon:yes gene_type:complete
MKLLTTYKQIKENTPSDNLLRVGYCSLQHLLHFEGSSVFAYSKGYYGWNCDYYDLKTNNQRFILSTGYRPIGKAVDYQMVRYYDRKACGILTGAVKVDDRKKAVKELLEEFLYYIDESNEIPIQLLLEIQNTK